MHNTTTEMTKDAAQQRHFSFVVAGETLQATIDYCGDVVPKPGILSLHGGGPAGRERIAWLTSRLAENNHPVLRFDHAGQGESSGLLAQSSLKARYDHALAATDYMDLTDGITLIGTSMGGHVALELLPRLPVKNLILFCPAAYAAAAFDVPFGEGFTEIIRQPDSYRDAAVFQHLQNFTGRFLFVIGSADDIIPPGVTEMYDHCTSRCSYKDWITLDQAPHPLHAWLPQQPEHERRVGNAVLRVIQS